VSSRLGRMLGIVCIGLFCATAASSPTRAADSPGITAQQLNSPIASKKVAGVLWTRRTDHYTLQVIFPRTGRVVAYVDGHKPQNPAVTLWLLSADGAAISTVREPPHAATKSVLPDEAEFSVSLSGGEEAVAAVLRVDDEYFVESLRSLTGK
jgi:hypothetical protein